MTMSRLLLAFATVHLAVCAQASLGEERPPAEDDGEKELIAGLVEANAQLSAANLATTKRIEELSKLISQTRERLKTTLEDRDDKLIRVVLLTDQLHMMHDRVKRLEERQKELVAQIARLEREAGEGAAVPAPPPVEGLVLAVRKNFMEISIGADDGIKAGHLFDVYRDQTYVGRVVVRKTNPDRAIAEVIPELMKQDVLQGDRLRGRPIHSESPE